MSGARWMGMILLYGGFLAASFVGVYDVDHAEDHWKSVRWSWYLPGFLVGVMGVIVLRWTSHGEKTQAHRVESDMASIEQSLSNLVRLIGVINSDRDRIGVYEIAQRIDGDLMDDLGVFVDARESLIQRFDLGRYAELMNQFAASERNLNRAWSASVDGYIDETWICLDTAESRMTAAKQLLDSFSRSD